MRTILTEAKPQGWRALALFEDGGERLLYLGLSSRQVRDGYVNAYFDVLDDEEREQVRGIALQRWNGAPDAGRWVQQCPLNMPEAKLAKSA